MIASIRGVQVAVGADRQGADAGELARVGAWFAPTGEELAVRVELADPLVLAELRDIVVARFVAHRVTDVAELAGGRALFAADALEQDAVGRIDADRRVVRIADDQVAV